MSPTNPAFAAALSVTLLGIAFPAAATTISSGTNSGTPTFSTVGVGGGGLSHLDGGQKLIVAGEADPLFPDLVGGPDSPDLRIDPNIPTSPFAGVVSIFVDAPGPGGFLLSGTAISPYHILTAAHGMDFNDDGIQDAVPSEVFTVFNNNGSFTDIIPAWQVTTHPDYTGFLNPYLNDDLSIITLSQPLPVGVPYYPLLPDGILDPVTSVFPIIPAGYGTTGDGINGYIPDSATFDTKRWGVNLLEAFDFDDEAGFDPTSNVELFAFDFERTLLGPLFEFGGFPIYLADPATDVFGLPFSFGNTLETDIGPGDSGGPSFVADDLGYLYLAGVNTFGGTLDGNIPGAFGNYGGGMWVPSYETWINDVVATVVPETSTSAAGLVLGGLGLFRWRRQRRWQA